MNSQTFFAIWMLGWFAVLLFVGIVILMHVL